MLPTNQRRAIVITWILISNSSHAVLFSSEKREDVWTLIRNFEHPEGRESSSEIRPTSPPGRMQTDSGGHSAVEPHTTPKEAESEHFAKLLANYLDQATAKGELESLVLVAPPHFLGLLHNTLGQQTTKHVKASVHKDFAMLDAAELRKRLIDDVFPPT
jgi:protein required for attachment to host cells